MKWLKTTNGLGFGRLGIVVSDGDVSSLSHDKEATCSVEIWVKSGATRGTSTLLVFSTKNNPMQLWIHAYQKALVLKRIADGTERQGKTIGIDNVFGRSDPLFLTFASGERQTSIYVDGHLVESFPGFRFGNECNGRLVIGTSTVGGDTWSGELRGLAIYHNELTPEETLQHYESWTTRGRPSIGRDEAAAGIYLFDEHAGSIVHNAVQPGINLVIPNRYSILHQGILEPVWKEFRLTRNYWVDVTVNIIGFIPLGFAFCAYWSTARPAKHPALLTIALGFAVSLTIEVLQAYLPTRDSSMTDVITNTLGTVLGVAICTSRPIKVFLAK